MFWQAAPPRSDAPKDECPGGCILAIVGSLKLEGNTEAYQIICQVFDQHQPRWFVSGGADGIDKMAEAEADRRGMQDSKTIHYPEKKGWHWYKKRDLLIAQQAECCVRIFSGTARTYGSGWTTNKAEELGARVWRFKVGDGPAPY